MGETLPHPRVNMQSKQQAASQNRPPSLSILYLPSRISKRGLNKKVLRIFCYCNLSRSLVLGTTEYEPASSFLGGGKKSRGGWPRERERGGWGRLLRIEIPKLAFSPHFYLDPFLHTLLHSSHIRFFCQLAFVILTVYGDVFGFPR